MKFLKSVKRVFSFSKNGNKATGVRTISADKTATILRTEHSKTFHGISLFEFLSSFWFLWNRLWNGRELQMPHLPRLRVFSQSFFSSKIETEKTQTRRLLPLANAQAPSNLSMWTAWRSGSKKKRVSNASFATSRTDRNGAFGLSITRWSKTKLKKRKFPVKRKYTRGSLPTTSGFGSSISLFPASLCSWFFLSQSKKWNRITLGPSRRYSRRGSSFWFWRGFWAGDGWLWLPVSKRSWKSISSSSSLTPQGKLTSRTTWTSQSLKGLWRNCKKKKKCKF